MVFSDDMVLPAKAATFPDRLCMANMTLARKKSLLPS